MDVWVVTTGGTFDKIYFDAKSTYTVGEPMAGPLLAQARIGLEYTVEPMLYRDSLEMTDEDRVALRAGIDRLAPGPVVVIHGTDTMAETAESLRDVDRTVVFTGALQPARMRDSDAAFNLGFAVAAARLLERGVYIAMQGRVFDAGDCRKDRETGTFMSLSGNRG